VEDVLEVGGDKTANRGRGLLFLEGDGDLKVWTKHML